MTSLSCYSYKRTRHLQCKVSIISLFCSLILTVTQLSSAASLYQKCPELSNKYHCKCIIESRLCADVLCAVDSPKPYVYVLIECYESTKNYKLLPKMEVQTENLSKGSIPQQLSVEQYITYLFDDYNVVGTNITREYFNGLPGLRRLHIRVTASQALYLPKDIFSNETLKNVIWLEFHAKNVELPVDIFTKLDNLISIKLGCNHLKSLPKGIFRNQHKLQLLNLASNKFHNLSKSFFEDLTSLKDLDLSNNDFEILSPDVFEPLKYLTHISLNGNRLHSLPEGLFSKNKNLTEIRLIKNHVPLKTLPSQIFANLPELQYVSLSCDLETVPHNIFSNSAAITMINMTDNKLTNLPAELLASQENLKDLDLSHNQLISLPENFFTNTTKLMSVTLSYNKLTEIQRELFSSLRNLRSLDLSNNRLITIHLSAFANTQYIEEINLENNQLTLSEPYAGLIDGLQNVLGSPFQYINHLRKLNLSNNSIMNIYQDWKYQLLKLEELDLSYNNITTLDDTDLEFLMRHDLKINLSHNQLRMVNFPTIDAFEISSDNKRIMMNLNRKSIQCECVLLNFVQFLRSEEVPYVRQHMQWAADTLVCNQPENLKDKPIKYLSLMDMLCYLHREDSNPKSCPRGCDCWIRLFDKVSMVNCTHSNDLLRIRNFKLLGTELY